MRSLGVTLNSFVILRILRENLPPFLSIVMIIQSYQSLGLRYFTRTDSKLFVNSIDITSLPNVKREGRSSDLTTSQILGEINCSVVCISNEGLISACLVLLGGVAGNFTSSVVRPRCFASSLQRMFRNPVSCWTLGPLYLHPVFVDRSIFRLLLLAATFYVFLLHFPIQHH